MGLAIWIRGPAFAAASIYAEGDLPPEFQSDIELNATEARRVKESGQGAIETKKDPLPTAAQRKVELGY